MHISASRPLPFFVAVALFLFYSDLLAWFYTADIYNQHFSENGSLVTLYNLVRTVFMGYFFWLIYWVGWRTLSWVDKGAINALTAAPRYVVCFFTGAGVWQVLLFISGMNGLDRAPIAFGVTVLVMLFSLPHLSQCILELFVSWLHYRRTSSKSVRWAARAFIATALLFILVKVLYPGGWYDYFTHYFHYFAAVIRDGSILPNEVWQHFYYSKGAGLYFLAILLTDPLSPELVCGVFMLMASLVVWLLVRRAGGNPLWAWCAAILYLGLQIYIQGTAYGNWGQLQKLHEMSAALTLAVLWCTITYNEQDAHHRRIWLITIIAAATASILFNSVMALVFVAYFGICVIGWWLGGKRREAFALIMCGTACMVVMAIIFTINYLFTGIPEDHFVILFWPYFSLPRLQQWGALFETFVYYYDQAVMRKMMANNSFGFSLLDVRDHLGRMLRLDLLYPLCLLAMARLVWVWKRKKDSGVRQYLIRTDTICYAALIISCTFFALTAGRVEVSSFYRFASFIFGPILCLAMAWIAGADIALGNKHSSKLAVTVTVLCLLMTYGSYRWAEVENTIENTYAFITGDYSLDDAYQHQPGLPVDGGHGAIHPAARVAWGLAGRNTRIWTLNSYIYCMLPHCYVQSFMASKLSNHSDRVLLGSAEEAKKILVAEGLNYFIIEPNVEIRDALPLSKLFAPDEISKHLGVVWTDGNSAVLTWKGADTKPIDPHWLELYRQTVHDSGRVKEFPLKELGEYFDLLKTRKGEAHPPVMPWDMLNRPVK